MIGRRERDGDARRRDGQERHAARRLRLELVHLGVPLAPARLAVYAYAPHLAALEVSAFAEREEGYVRRRSWGVSGD